MRPVNKGAPATYPYVVDVSSQAQLEATLKAFTITFGTSAAAKAEALWDTDSPTAWQVLSSQLLVAKKVPPPKKRKKGVPSSADMKLFKPTLDPKLSSLYGQAAGDLETRLGRFCSFCELYTTTGLAVEHRAPKAPYPLFYLAWDNFLLACTVCNSIKKSKPPRNDPLFAVAPATEAGYFAAIEDGYLWPDVHTYTFRNTKPVLEYFTEGRWWQVSHPVAEGTEMIERGERDRQPLADVCSNTHDDTGKLTAEWFYKVPVRVQVVPGGPLSTKMVDELVKLNKPSSNIKKAGAEADIRTWTRTIMWFKAVRSLRRLLNADADNFDTLWDSMLESVEQPGVYSVWVTVLDLLGPNGSWKVPNTTMPVMTKFLTTITGAGYFPGTDIGNTP